MLRCYFQFSHLTLTLTCLSLFKNALCFIPSNKSHALFFFANQCSMSAFVLTSLLFCNIYCSWLHVNIDDSDYVLYFALHCAIIYHFCLFAVFICIYYWWHFYRINLVCNLCPGLFVQEKWKATKQRMEEEICDTDGRWSSYLLPQLQCKCCAINLFCWFNFAYYKLECSHQRACITEPLLSPLGVLWLI